MSAPRSAQRSPAFGVLAAATQADVKRWIQLLEVSGALEQFESDDGFRLLRAVTAPSCRESARAGSPDESLFELLRSWRLERARTERSRVRRPTRRDAEGACDRETTSQQDLAAVKGFGPAKLERYAADVLAVISAAPG